MSEVYNHHHHHHSENIDYLFYSKNFPNVPL